MPRRLALGLLVALPLALLGLTAPGHAAQSWSWPLPGTPAVDRSFQPPASAWGPGHRGVDLRGELREPVLAAGAGTVTYAGLLAGRGVVTVSHPDGLRTTYEPVDAMVGVGDWVEAGDVIGLLGTGHASCRLGTVCLHWGLLRGETYLDPLTLVVGGHVRLLPLLASAPPADKGDPPHPKRDRLREKPAKESFAKRLGRAAKRVAAGTPRAVARAGKAVGRAIGRVGRAVGRVGLSVGKVVARVALGLGKLVLRAGARAGVRAALVLARIAPIAVDALPWVAAVALVVGAGVWFFRRR